MSGKTPALLVFLIAAAFSLPACQPVAEKTETPPVKTTQACMGPVLKERMCTMQYEPVCGCNGKTYANACVAKAAGVLHLEKGACADDPSAADPNNQL